VAILEEAFGGASTHLYALTEFGVSLVEALRPLCDWGREHMERIEGAKGEAG
jgi:DNA-binding HxlR family transcriptional regulator